MDEQNVGYEEFMEAFDDSVGNQTDAEENTFVEEDPAAEAAADAPAAEEEPDTASDTPEGSEDDSEKPSDKPEETFTLKVNKEERTYSREEVISLAQKGADYDRVKEQLGKSQQTVSELQSQLAPLTEHQETMESLQLIAKELNTDIPKLLDGLRLSAYRKQGLSDEVANERLLRMKAEQENARLKSGKSTAVPVDENKQRVQKDLDEFRKAYPDVQLTQDLLQELMPNIQDGVSMLQAYRKREIAQKDAVIAERDQKIAELERKIDAEKQNKANRAGSPGSQKDTGGKRTKSDYDDFMEAFN